MTENVQTPGAGARAFAITALVAGIVALAAAWSGWFAIVVGIVAVVFGILALRARQTRGLAVGGLVTGGLGIVGGIITLVIVTLVMNALTEAETFLQNMEEGDGPAVVEQLEKWGAETDE